MKKSYAHPYIYMHTKSYNVWIYDLCMCVYAYVCVCESMYIIRKHQKLFDGFWWGERLEFCPHFLLPSFSPFPSTFFLFSFQLFLSSPSFAASPSPPLLPTPIIFEWLFIYCAKFQNLQCFSVMRSWATFIYAFIFSNFLY